MLAFIVFIRIRKKKIINQSKAIPMPTALAKLHYGLLKDFKIDPSIIKVSFNVYDSSINISCLYARKVYYLIISTGFLNLLQNDMEAPTKQDHTIPCA